MEVQWPNEDKPKRTFGSLSCGDTFRRPGDGALWMKMCPAGYYNMVRIKDGGVSALDLTSPVDVWKAHVVVEGVAT